MSGILPLLIEISALTDRSDAAWTDDIKVGVCKLMRLMLLRDSPMHSFVVHDSRREDCVSICLAMAQLASRADDKLELTRTLRAKLHSLTSKCICMALQSNCNAALHCFVDATERQQSLERQLQL
jgi:hypothetical protein